MDVLTTVSTRKTPQSEQADPRQVANNGGGYSFTVSNEEQVRRFLTLGTDGGTYYVDAKTLTADAAKAVIQMANEDHAKLVSLILDISTRGAAPRQNPALFALAIAASVDNIHDRRKALNILPKVARTGTHLFLFATYVQQFRGWGRGLRSAIGSWYTHKSIDNLAYQVVKYRQREGWTHRDLLRLSHPRTGLVEQCAVFEWITHGAVSDNTPALIKGFIEAQEPSADHASLVTGYGLSWEMLPDVALNNAAVWEALLNNGLPQTALMRQLPRLTRLGMFPNWSKAVAEQLTDPERLRKARVHPINVLVAQRTYASGQSARGSSTWKPDRQIVDALDEAFYAAFGAVEPANKRTLIALDVSGSMGWGGIANMPLTPREASAALALVQMRTEPEVDVVGFSDELIELTLSPRQRLDDAIDSISRLPFGSTDCAAPMEWALREGRNYDTFVVYTDNETNSGSSHPHQALDRYRRTTGIDAKLIVVGMTATNCSIADPSDPGMLDVAGFDSAVPNLINDFSRGI